MGRASAFGRDKPHSPLNDPRHGSAPDGLDAPPSFTLAIGLGLVLAALLVAVSPLPVAPWTRAEHSAAPGPRRQTAAVLAGATPSPAHAPEELGLRLAVLRGLAAP